jgi:hypothetical protein
MDLVAIYLSAINSLSDSWGVGTAPVGLGLTAEDSAAARFLRASVLYTILEFWMEIPSVFESRSYGGFGTYWGHILLTVGTAGTTVGTRTRAWARFDWQNGWGRVAFRRLGQC